MGPSKVALVTGGGRGIGREIALGLAAAGRAVGLVGRSPGPLEEAAAECRSRGGRAVAAPADVTDPQAFARAADVIEAEFGPVDLLVNNAGRIETREAGFAETSLSDFWDVVMANLRGPAVAIHRLLPDLVARGGGRIVNINSGFGYRTGDVYTGYSVSKGALARLTAMIAHQYAAAGVIAIDVSPGLVPTDMTRGMPMWAGTDTQWGTPGDIVRVMVAVANGRLDALSGRFVHAAKDDLDTLVARAQEIVAAGAREVRLVPYGPDDPLAD